VLPPSGRLPNDDRMHLSFPARPEQPIKSAAFQNSQNKLCVRRGGVVVGRGSLTAVRLCRAIDPGNLAVHEKLDVSDGRVHEGLCRINKGVDNLAPVGNAPVRESFRRAPKTGKAGKLQL
jgi:hypothetical protein